MFTKILHIVPPHKALVVIGTGIHVIPGKSSRLEGSAAADSEKVLDMWADSTYSLHLRIRAKEQNMIETMAVSGRIQPTEIEAESYLFLGVLPKTPPNNPNQRIEPRRQSFADGRFVTPCSSVQEKRTR